jgi:hypothetical protein
MNPRLIQALKKLQPLQLEHAVQGEVQCALAPHLGR